MEDDDARINKYIIGEWECEMVFGKKDRDEHTEQKRKTREIYISEEKRFLQKKNSWETS